MVAEFFPSSPEHVGQANYSGITQSGVWRNRLTACVCVSAREQHFFSFKPYKKTKSECFHQLQLQKSRKSTAFNLKL